VGRKLRLVPLKGSEYISLVDEAAVHLGHLPVGDYALELPASEDLPRCPLIDRFTVECATGYETLNGEGICYPESPIKLWLTIVLTGVVVVCLVGIFGWIYKKRQSVVALFTSVMKNEGMAGVQITNETLDLAGDAAVYHSMATQYRYMHTLLVFYTIFFAIAVLVSAIAMALKLKALRLQLRMRRQQLALPVSAGTDPAAERRRELKARLEECRKEQLQVYATALTAALEDLPMGILGIVLGSQLPAGEKLSLINNLSMTYSWFNLGGKLLKLAGLLRLWALEKDTLRKLEKLDADESTDAPNVVPDSTWHALRRWMHALVSRKHARQGDAELKLVQAFVSQAQSDRAAHDSLLTRAAVIHDTSETPSQPNSPHSVRAMRTF
jgi:hypothetical protein